MSAFSQSSQKVDSDQRADQAETTLVEVANPLERLCVTDPTVRERVGTACDTAAQAVRVGPRGASGSAGVDGSDGAPGRDGIAGRDGRDGQVGLTGPPGIEGEPGEPGVDGDDGTPGDDGNPGVDGNAITGPAGQAGPPGPEGPSGPAGTPGAPGVDGRNGSPPAAWTFTDATGVTYTCTRSNDDDSAPTYGCAPPTPVDGGEQP